MRCTVKPRSVLVVSGLLIGSIILGCAPAGPSSEQAQAPPPGVPAVQVHGTLDQVMKGILFPSSNVIFAAQSDNPADVKPAADPALATNPLASSYGGWQAVENSSLAIAEAANLLTIPGRKCSNG